MAKKFYNIKRIKGVDAQFKILLGGRNIGKSYAVKHDVMKECYKHGKEFVYLRRWDEDIKTKYAEQYFTDVDVKGITDGKYTNVYIWQGKIYFSNYDDKGKVSDKMLIGYSHSLNQSERYKSQIFQKVNYIIFEEFITDRIYLQNEPNTLQEYVSTIFRTRTGVVYLVGNTISKLCPYFNEWKLDKVERMKTHEINVFENETVVVLDNETTNVVVRVAVEMCGAESILSKMAFGDSANMIIKNTWRSKTMPILDKKTLEESEEIYSMYVCADNLKFKMTLLVHDNKPFWYVVPQTTELRHPEHERMITDEVSMYPLHTCTFAPLNERETYAFGLILQKKIYYCSNTCGSDFEQVLKKYHMVKL